MVILFTLTACSLINQETDTAVLGHTTTFAIDTTAVLTCSQECANRKQCGTANEQSDVILAGRDRPQTGPHDIFLPATQSVTIRNATTVSVQYLPSNEQASLTFYDVVLADGSKSGWVAGWCVAAP